MTERIVMAFFKRNSEDGVEDVESKTEKLDKEFDNEAKREKRLAKYKLGKHHIIERQLITLGIAGSILLFGAGVSLAGNIAKNRVTLTSKAVYTQKASFSKNKDVTAETKMVGVSKDGKTGYLLLYFEDASSISQNADNYKAWLSAYQAHLDSNPVGEVFVFGSTGYVGVRIHDEKGLPNQILDVTLRANKDVAQTVTKNDDITTQNGYANSFKKFNQLRIYANFGAKKATKVDLSESSSPTDMYYELVAKPEDKALRKTVKSQVVKIQHELDRIEEYENSIVNAGYDTPTRPSVLQDISVKNGELKTSLVVPGGYNIAPNTTLKDGYLSQFIVGDVTDDSVSNLLAVKAEEQGSLGVQMITDADGTTKQITINTNKDLVKGLTTVSDDPTNSLKITSLTKTSTGEVLYVNSVQSDINSSAEMAVAETASNLSAAYVSLYNDIVTLQRDVNAKRIKLDEELFSQNTLYSQASGKDHFEVWQQVDK